MVDLDADRGDERVRGCFDPSGALFGADPALFDDLGRLRRRHVAPAKKQDIPASNGTRAVALTSRLRWNDLRLPIRDHIAFFA